RRRDGGHRWDVRGEQPPDPAGGQPHRHTLAPAQIGPPELPPRGEVGQLLAPDRAVLLAVPDEVVIDSHRTLPPCASTPPGVSPRACEIRCDNPWAFLWVGSGDWMGR